MADDLEVPDEIVIDGNPMYRQPSEGWTYFLMIAPQFAPMKLLEQPIPKDQLMMHRAEAPNDSAIVFTCISRDEDERCAYFLKGSFEFREAPKDIFDADV
ncbi:MAG: hypothetical protein K5880_13795 [Hydrogenophaga sp.]|uniref:hypothetical protein n=1 Tax=Hydrogenophaga sp. TaxID=1904254 RepID=UPI0026174AA4|nr:hypothetical protein [Hydrogenophaga sp.]MCV0439694.1 hypothetical protein [Hydrogenophaga sp.]